MVSNPIGALVKLSVGQHFFAERNRLAIGSRFYLFFEDLIEVLIAALSSFRPIAFDEITMPLGIGEQRQDVDVLVRIFNNPLEQNGKMIQHLSDHFFPKKVSAIF